MNAKMVRVLTAGLLFSTILIGCGVSKRSQEVRQEAYTRMDRVNAGMIHEQATTAFETGQLDKALSLAGQATNRYPKGPGHHVLRGRILMEVDRLAEAERSLREAIQLDEEQAEAYYFLGIIYERLSRDDLAYEQFAKAAQRKPDQLQFLMAQAESLMVQGHLEQAESLIRERLSQFEHNAALHHLHGQLMVFQGRSEEAAKSYEMASLLAPEDQTLLEELVRVRHRQGDHSGALAGLHELRYLYRSDVDDDLRLIEARSLAAVGRSNEARPVYLAMIDANPSQLSLWREFGMFSWDIEDWRSVARCGSRLTKAGDVNPCGRLLMAVASRERGDLTEARLRLEGILEDHPGNVMASTLLTQVCLHHGDLGEAQKAWQVAVKSAPEGADVTRVTGILGNGP